MERIKEALVALSRAASHTAVALGEANSARNRAEAAYAAARDAERAVASAMSILVAILKAEKLAEATKGGAS